jgi:hypothetical protein
VITYKQNVKCYKYFNAWEDFKEIFNLLKLDNISNSSNLSSRKVSHDSTNLKESEVVSPAPKHKLSIESNDIKIDSEFENMAKQLISSDNLRYLKILKKDLQEIFDSNLDSSKYNNELNSKLFDLLKSNIFSDVYDNLLIKYFNDFYKTISKEKSFTEKLEMILQHLFKDKNNFNTNSLIDLESSLYTQQTFYTRLTMPIEPSNSETVLGESNSSTSGLRKLQSSVDIINLGI